MEPASELDIIVSCPIFYPSFAAGGVTRVAYDTAIGLSRRGHRVAVFTSDILFDRSLTPQKRRVSTHGRMPVDVAGVPTYYHRHILPNLRWRTGFTVTPGLGRAVSHALRSADVVHLHELRTYQTLVVAREARRAGVPYFVSPHGALPQESGRSALKRIFDATLSRKILENAAGIIALNDEERDQIRQFGVNTERIFVVPNSVELMPPTPSDASALADRFQIDRNASIVLYVGRLHQRKRIDLLIRAMPEIAKAVKPAHLLVVGPDDGSLNELQQLSSELGQSHRITFTGPVSEEDKRLLLQHAQVFALTSRHEGQPITLLEACAAGVPVVFTPGTNFSIAQRYGAGAAVEDTPSTIAEGIVSFLVDPDGRSKASSNAITLVREEYSLSRQLERLEAAYRSATAQRGD